MRAPRSIFRAAAEEGNARAAARDGLTAVGLLTGLPVGPLGQLADEETDELTMRGLVAGR